VLENEVLISTSCHQQSYSIQKMNSGFKERLAWLGRMPTRWRILLGSQAVIFMIAVSVRMSDVNRSRELLILREQQGLQQVDSRAKKTE
jgi:hypothetical protein